MRRTVKSRYAAWMFILFSCNKRFNEFTLFIEDTAALVIVEKNIAALKCYEKRRSQCITQRLILDINIRIG